MSSGANYILSKQALWAKRKGIELIGSKGERGFPAYTQQLDENLFEPMADEARNSFEHGDGGELSSEDGTPPKMNAVHSSSALSVNVFHHWITSGKASDIAHACGLCAKQNQTSESITFERKFPISKAFKFPPNVDVVIENNIKSPYKAYAIECKFSEAYSTRKHKGMEHQYFNSDILPLWKDIPELQKFAKAISPDDREYQFLHPAQLIKHILGLKRQYGKKAFRLLYLWYDVLGEEGYRHRTEIDKFAEYAKADDVKFCSISYQELIVSMAKNHYDTNEEYINYLTDRYL